MVRGRCRDRHDGKPPGDRPENNKASAHVVARGTAAHPLLEGKEGDQKLLADTLLAAGEVQVQLVAKPVSVLDNYKDQRRAGHVSLSNFDCVILADVPEELVSEDQQKMLRSNTQDQGCGLIMIGGPDSFGAGGWQDTPVEKALPVDSQHQVAQGAGQGRPGAHHARLRDAWTATSGKRRSPNSPSSVWGRPTRSASSMVNEQWHIPFQEIGGNRDKLLAQLDKLLPGDMPTFDNALKMAHTALNKDDNGPEKRLATKHVIIISDGDPQVTMPPSGLLPAMKRDKIIITTVGVATHGGTENKNMQTIADACNSGTAISTTSTTPTSCRPSTSRNRGWSASRSSTSSDFKPIVTFRSGPTEGLPDPGASLHGLRPHDAQAVGPGRNPDHHAEVRRPGVPAAGLLALRPGQVGGLHQRRGESRSIGRGDWQGPGGIYASSGSRWWTGRCGRPKARACR